MELSLLGATALDVTLRWPRFGKGVERRERCRARWLSLLVWRK